MKLLSAATSCLLVNVGLASKFLGNNDASQILSRVRRNNVNYEWNKRSDLNRECQEEDCVFEEFWEHAENRKNQYGHDRSNAQKAFDALYTKECGKRGNTAERINARRQCVHNLNKSLLDNKDRWVSCVCDNGNKPVGYKCTSDVPKGCKSCNKGYTKVKVQVPAHSFVDASECKFNRCKCFQGTGAVGSECPQDGHNKCTSCNSGYSLVNGICQLNECSCSNGTPFTGVFCPKNGEVACSACDEGYHRDNSLACIENQCVCQNGNAATGLACPHHGTHKCACPNAATSDDGSADDYPQYATGDLPPDYFNSPDSACACNSGYQLIGDRCEARCSCENGVEMSGRQCNRLIRSGKFEGCVACNNGYELNAQTRLCEPKICTCDNGTPNNFCGSQKHHCQSCDAGYHLAGLRCEENRCSCRNGWAAHGADCSVHNSAKCAVCSSEFRLQDGACISKAQVCRGAPLDLVFVLDGSTSVRPSQFDKMVRFMIAITSKFEIGPDSARVGLVQYSNHIFKEIDYTSNDDDLQVKMTHLTQRGGRTHTGEAIAFAHSEFFRKSPRHSEKVMIVITDGEANDDVSAPSRAAVADGITMIALGYNNADQAELLQIAQDPHCAMMGSSVPALVKLRGRVVKQVCETVWNKRR